MFDARTLKLVAALLVSPALLVLVLSLPASAKTVTYKPQTVYFTYCYSHPPAARIASGDTVVTNIRDASNDAFQPTMKTSAEGKLDLSRVNPQTGPSYVEGAEPGDTPKVHPDKVTVTPHWGSGGALRYFGARAHDDTT